jgi:hypothetical protein
VTFATPAAADLLPPEWWEAHQLMAAAAADVPVTAATLPRDEEVAADIRQVAVGQGSPCAGHLHEASLLISAKRSEGDHYFLVYH